MAKKNENIAEETVKKTTKKAKTEGEAVEKTEEEIAAEIAAKFDEKCKGLLQIAKKKKNVLDYQEIMNYFSIPILKPIRWKKSLNSLKIIMSMLRWRMMIQTTMKLF